MPDFTSSLYLGLTHASSALEQWTELTTGAPAALRSVQGTARVEKRLAALQGCESATLAVSTLHLAWDLFGVLSKRRVAIHVDEGAYAITHWGVERASALGKSVRTFPHHDANALRSAMRRTARPGVTPLVVTDGYCPACGSSAPLVDYLDIARLYGGSLIIDDTQALGIFGKPSRRSSASTAGDSPKPSRRSCHGKPYGNGGGGSLRKANIRGPDITVIASLAKGFGAPIAALSGSHETVRIFVGESNTRVHCSPPSRASVAAAKNALRENDDRGDVLRRRLLDNVLHFQARLQGGGVEIERSLFPVQALPPIAGFSAARVHLELGKRGIRTFLSEPRCVGKSVVGMVIRADHSFDDLDHAALAVLDIIHEGPTSGAKTHGLCREEIDYVDYDRRTRIGAT